MSNAEVRYADLRKARSRVIRQAGVNNPGKGSLDTTTPMVKAGLEVVEFDVMGATQFARELTSKNLYRISVAKGQYSIDLFTAAICSGLAYGAMTERRRGS
jgi:hypothetical protein